MSSAFAPVAIETLEDWRASHPHGCELRPLMPREGWRGYIDDDGTAEPRPSLRQCHALAVGAQGAVPCPRTPWAGAALCLFHTTAAQGRIALPAGRLPATIPAPAPLAKIPVREPAPEERCQPWRDRPRLRSVYTSSAGVRQLQIPPGAWRDDARWQPFVALLALKLHGPDADHLTWRSTPSWAREAMSKWPADPWPDPWPPKASGTRRIAWAPLPGLDDLRDRRGQLVRSKVDAISARQSLAERRLGADEAAAVRESGAAFRALLPDAERVTIRAAADEALAQDVWGVRGDQPGTGQRGLRAHVSLSGLDVDIFVPAGSDLPVRSTSADGTPIIGSDVDGDAGDVPDEVVAEDEESTGRLPPSDAARDARGAREGGRIVDGFELLEDREDGEDDERSPRQPGRVAGPSLGWSDPVFDAVWRRHERAALYVKASAVTPEACYSYWRRRLDDDGLALHAAIAALPDELGAALFAVSTRIPLDAEFLARFVGVALTTIYRRAERAAACLRSHPALVDIWERQRAALRAPCTDSWRSHPRRVPPRRPTFEPHWASPNLSRMRKPTPPGAPI